MEHIFSVTMQFCTWECLYEWVEKKFKYINGIINIGDLAIKQLDAVGDYRNYFHKEKQLFTKNKSSCGLLRQIDLLDSR